MGWFDHQCFSEMAFDGSKLVVYDRKRRACNTAVGAYAHQPEALERTIARIFLEFEHVDMSFVRHSDEVVYVHRLNDWLQIGANTGTLDSESCCLGRPFHSYFLVQEAAEYEWDLGLHVR